MVKKIKKSFDFFNFSLILSFFFIFFLYLGNLTRDIYGGDVGDLVVSSYVLGVAHPPGYPLFTLLGALFAHLPIPLPVVSRVGLISVLSGALGVAVYFKYCQKVSQNLVICLLSSSILAFSYLFWFYSELPEVFALNNLLVILLFFVAYLYYKTSRVRYLYALSFLLSFSLTNHHTAILVFPSVLILILPHFKQILRNKKTILFMFLSFLVGFTPYIYVPIAASFKPIINWDNASNLENFIRLVTRQDYGTFSAGIFQRANVYEQVVVVKTYFMDIVSSMTFPSFVVGVIGAVFLFKKDKILLASILLAFFLTGPLFIVYAGFPLLNTFILGASERFYTLSLVVFLFFLPFGFLAIKNLADLFFRNKLYPILILLAFLIIPLSLFRSNFPKTNLSKVTLGNDLSRDYLDILPKDAVLFMSGDTIVFNNWYVHYVLGERDDVELVQLGGFANDDFFRKQREAYMKDTKETNDGKILFGSMLMINEKRPIFLTSPLDSPFSNIEMVPWGLVLQPVVTEKLPTEEQYLKRVGLMWKDIDPPKRSNLSIAERNLTLSDIPTIYANSLVRTANFIYEKYKNTNEALKYYKLATEVDPDFSKSYAGIGVIQYTEKNQCQDAEGNIRKAIELNPLEKNYYLLLYLVYKNCFRDEKKTENFKNWFNEAFKRDLLKEFDTKENK